MVICFLSGRALPNVPALLSEAWKKGKLQDVMMARFEESIDAELFLRMSDLAETGKGTLPVMMSWR